MRNTKNLSNIYEKCRHQDVYHKALIYCLGISEDTRVNIESYLRFENRICKDRMSQEGWQTSGSVRIVRMAFNLYCNGTPSVYDYESEEGKLQEYAGYTPEELFCCG